MNGVDVRRADRYWSITYSAMASPCEVLVRCKSENEASSLASLAYIETMRIEQKFSRYRKDNIVHTINTANGKPVQLDDETLHLVHYATKCYEISDGMFDITSGLLRKAWKFEGKEVSPNWELIESLMHKVGWHHAILNGHELRLLSGMEIDFGGIGKEYAVDRIAQMLFNQCGVSLMVNFGGDIRAIRKIDDSEPWHIGIENPNVPGVSVKSIELLHGAVATSGNGYRHCFYKGKKLGHILNPKTGWPIDDTPQSVTVIADFCMEAGLLTTLAILHGKGAKEFLQNQNVQFHCIP